MSEVSQSNNDSPDPVGIEPRRVPVQARSRERVERILDAAIQLLIEDGYDAVKTNLIAKRAGVSIGSVYQFFPNRFAIFNALATRYRERIANTLSAHMGPQSPHGSWEESLEATIDILGDMWRTDWAFHSVWLAIQNTAELAEARDQYRSTLVNKDLVYFVQKILPNTSATQVQTIARVILETSNLLLDQSMGSGDAQNDIIIDELKFLLHSYIQQHINSTRAAQLGSE